MFFVTNLAIAIAAGVRGAVAAAADAPRFLRWYGERQDCLNAG